MNSKSALILFGYELAQRLEGSGVTVNSLCPGKSYSDINVSSTLHVYAILFTGFIPGTELGRGQGYLASLAMRTIFPLFIWLGIVKFAVPVSEGVRRVDELTTS